MTVNDTRAPDGVSYEGGGIPVDFEVQSGEPDADAALDRAIKLARQL